MEAAALGITSEERIRRFWRAHARSFAHLTVLHAFCSNPGLAWTPERLSSLYGLRVDRTRTIARELAACRILHQVQGGVEAYQWNPALAWIDPASPATREVLRMARTLKEIVSASPGFADHEGGQRMEQSAYGVAVALSWISRRRSRESGRRSPRMASASSPRARNPALQPVARDARAQAGAGCGRA